MTNNKIFHCGPYGCGPCRGIIHVIERGDTLYKLGRFYHVSVSELMFANPFVNVYNLQIGDELCIPVGHVAPEQPAPLPIEPVVPMPPVPPMPLPTVPTFPVEPGMPEPIRPVPPVPITPGVPVLPSAPEPIRPVPPVPITPGVPVLPSAPEPIRPVPPVPITPQVPIMPRSTMESVGQRTGQSVIDAMDSARFRNKMFENRDEILPRNWGESRSEWSR